MDPKDDIDRVGQAFTAQLDQAGYSFHYAVIRRCEEIARKPSEQKLSFEASEFPVQTQGADSRVDFILRSYSDFAPVPVLLVCECKRSNPALSDWCFARAPYVRRNKSEPRVIGEIMEYGPHPQDAKSHPVTFASMKKPYHLGLPIKADHKGDPRSDGREAIERAAGQVICGLNGFAEFLQKNPNAVGRKPVLLIPVIFTTATLYVSDVDLGAATLTTGKLPEPASVERSSWVWFQYHVSPGLRHTVHRSETAATMDSIGVLLDSEYSRSIGIVSPGGIEEFLRSITHASDLLDAVR